MTDTNIEFFGHTDIGTKRESNEDNYLCLEIPPRPPLRPAPAALLMVADGIGGQVGGGVASALAVDTLKDYLPGRLAEASGPPDWQAVLAESFQEANRRIFKKIAQDGRLSGMGTTLVAAVLSDGAAHVANVGDSRAYQVRREEIRQVSRDHSWVAEQSRVRTMSDWEISRSPFRHMITRSLGFEAEVRADYFEVVLEPGDFVLLCSDGLYSALSDEKILRVFGKHRDPEKICRKLLKWANHSGSRDNITAVVARFGSPAKKARRAFSETVQLEAPPAPESEGRDSEDDEE
jgi:serine/threonine protein phosphatase PrpC